MIWGKSTPFFNFFYFFLFYFLYLHLMQFCSVIFLFLTANFWSEMPGFWRRVLHCWDFDGMSWIFFFSNLIFPSFFIQIRQLLLQIRIFLPDAPSYSLYENRPICLQISPIKQPSILMQNIYASDKLWYQIPSPRTFCLFLPSFSSTSFVQRFTPVENIQKKWQCNDGTVGFKGTVLI